MKSKKKNFYVIRNGPNPGIYTSVEAYLDHSNGVPNLEAHGFMTQRGAERYMITGDVSSFYGVHIGRKVGVTDDVRTAQKMTRKVAYGCYKTFECKEDALHYAKTGEIPRDGHWIPMDEEGNAPKEHPTIWKRMRETLRSKANYPVMLRERLFALKKRMSENVQSWKEKGAHVWWIIRRGQFYRQNGIALLDGKPLPCHIYTDGSSNRGWHAWAFVVYQGKKIIYAETGSGKNNIHKNVASDEAEMQAMMHAVRWMEKMRLTEAEIYYDNAALGNFLDGKAIPHTPLTVRYQKWMLGHLRNLNIKMWKIKGHSGISGNAIADCMARDALMRCHQDWTEGHVLI